MPDLEADLKRMKEELEKAKESKVEIAKKTAELEQLKKEQVSLKNKIASGAVAGFQRCLDMVVLLDPKAQADLQKVEHKTVDGRIVKGDQIVYVPPSLSSPNVVETGELAASGNETHVVEDKTDLAAEDKNAPEAEGVEIIGGDETLG